VRVELGRGRLAGVVRYLRALRVSAGRSPLSASRSRERVRPGPAPVGALHQRGRPRRRRRQPLLCLQPASTWLTVKLTDPIRSAVRRCIAWRRRSHCRVDRRDSWRSAAQYTCAGHGPRLRRCISRRRRGLATGTRLIPMNRSSECSRVSAVGVPLASAKRQQQRICDELGLDQAAADCVAREVDAVAHAELVEDVGAVAFDGFDAENERRCDFL
jgi:hypothetical protein